MCCVFQKKSLYSPFCITVEKESETLYFNGQNALMDTGIHLNGAVTKINFYSCHDIDFVRLLLHLLYACPFISRPFILIGPHGEVFEAKIYMQFKSLSLL